MSPILNSVEWYLTEAVVLDDLVKVKELIISHGLPSEGHVLLVDAVKLGRTAIVKYLVERGAKVKSSESKADILLHLAIANGELEIVQTLLEANAVVDASEGYTLLSNVEKSEVVETSKGMGATANSADPNVVPRPHLPVHLACEKGCLKIVKFLLETRKDYINYIRLKDGFSPLHSACENGQLEVVGYLLSEGADPNFGATGSVTPLHLAAKGGHLKVVDLLCKNGANIEALTFEGLTPLLIAAKNGNADVVKMLFYRGAFVNDKDKKGNTPLSFAVENRSSPLTTFLLQFKPVIGEEFFKKICKDFRKDYNPAIDDLIVHCIVTKLKTVNDFSLATAVCKGYFKTVENLIACGVDPSDYDLLHLAVKNGRFEVVQVLLNAGCAVSSKNKHGRTPIHYLFKHDERSKYLDIFKLLLSSGANVKEGPDLLHEAVTRRYVDICRCLIENGADVNSTGYLYGNTPLEYVVCESDEEETHECESDEEETDECESDEDKNDGATRGEIARLLLKSGAHVLTTLHDAAKNGFVEVVLAFLDFKADINAVGEDSRTPLHFAVESGHRDIVDILLKNGADVNATNRWGCAPLHDAAGSGHRDIVDILLKNGADVNAKDQDGYLRRTPLHYAAGSGHRDIVDILLKNGADVNAKDQDGYLRRTPLHYAAGSRQRDTVEILLKNGADADAADIEGERPLHLCAGKANVGILKLLLSFHADINAQDAEGNTALHQALCNHRSMSYECCHLVTILLDNGCDVNIRNQSGKTALAIDNENRFIFSGELRFIVLKHVLKLKAAGLFINDQNKQLLYDVWLIRDDEFEQWKQECSEEVERMKQFKLCCHLTLHDVLANPSNPAFVANELVISSLESIDLSQFPIYHGLLQNNSKKNKEISSSKHWLNVLIKTRSVLHQENALCLPVELLLEIVSFLDRKDLRHLIVCGEALKRQLC